MREHGTRQCYVFGPEPGPLPRARRRPMKATPVYVFGERPIPTYHRSGKAKDGTLRAVCGRVIMRLNGDRYWQEYATRLRLDWVLRLDGHPCACCYPEGDDR